MARNTRSDEVLKSLTSVLTLALVVATKAQTHWSNNTSWCTRWSENSVGDLSDGPPRKKLAIILSWMQWDDCLTYTTPQLCSCTPSHNDFRRTLGPGETRPVDFLAQFSGARRCSRGLNTHLMDAETTERDSIQAFNCPRLSRGTSVAWRSAFRDEFAQKRWFYGF